MTDAPNPEAAKQIKKLNQLEKVGTKPLLQIQTIFPFRIFPCVITLDRQKLTISDKFFFSSKEVENFLAKDIVSIASTESMFYATINLVSGMRINKEVSVPFLKKEDARKLRRLVQGLLIAGKEGIDVNQIPENQLIAKLEEIGSAQAM